MRGHFLSINNSVLTSHFNLQGINLNFTKISQVLKQIKFMKPAISVSVYFFERDYYQ